jgi:DMSO/TMAO reductase YedYZ molybdopterin-dependent catalytic subunit
VIDRRKLLLGGAALALSGCKVLDDATRGSALHTLFASAEKLTMTSQRLLGRDALAPTFDIGDIRQGQRPNGSVDADSPEYLALAQSGFAKYQLKITGLVENALTLDLEAVRNMNRQSQITRHDCVEGWSCIAKWTGTPLRTVLNAAKPKSNARYVVFHCFDAIERGLSGNVFYYESIDLIDAYHPQTLLAYGLNDKPLPRQHGAPIRLRVERQLGYKHAKFIHTIELTDTLLSIGSGRGSYWADRGYEWYAGI